LQITLIRFSLAISELNFFNAFRSEDTKKNNFKIKDDEQNGKISENVDHFLEFELRNNHNLSDIDDALLKSTKEELVDSKDVETKLHDTLLYENISSDNQSRITIVLNGDENEFENENFIENSKYEISSSEEYENSC
jgi:hypothetical protein